MYCKYYKRLIDFIISFLGLIFVSPIFIALLILLAIVNKGKPFFIQKRPGKNERIFSIIKFNTMRDTEDAEGNLLPDEMRSFKTGTFIRKSSLDEIPQLLNVFIGDMSLIGPRPLLVEYLPLYNDFQRQRHKVKPGITGWAQINGRNAITWQQKFEYDIWYVNNLSFSLDVRIFFLTIKKVLKREGINSSLSITMEKFTGNNIKQYL